MKPYRLDLYNKYIINFDFLDRNINRINTNVFKSVKMKTEKNLSSSKVEFLTLALSLEILAQQRFLIKLIKNKTFSKFSYFQIHINKNKFLSLLDIFLIFTFFNQLDKYNFLNIKLLRKLYIFIPSQVIDNLNLTTIHKGRSYFDLGIKNNFYKFY